MRILLVVPIPPAEDGGGAIPKLLAAQLAGLGERHDVTLVTSVGDESGEAKAARQLLAAGLDVHIADRRVPASLAPRWRRRARLAGGWVRGNQPWRVLWYAEPKIQAELDRLAARRDFDIVAIEDSPMSGFRYPRGVPTVYTEHEALRAPEDSWRPQRLRERPVGVLRVRDWRRWPAFQRSIWEKFDLIQTYGRGDAEAIGALAPELADRVRVNPFGTILPAALDPGLQKPGTVLFVGNFSHPPNRDAALWLGEEIMPLVWARAPEARLELVGTAAPAEVLGLAGPRIEVCADVPSVRPHLEAAAVVAAPVRSGGGMRMKVLEALASAKAVVTTPLGADGYTEFDEPPPLAMAETAAGLAEAISALLLDDGGRRQIGQRAREFAVRHHSPGAWALRLEDVYEEARRRAGAKSATS